MPKLNPKEAPRGLQAVKLEGWSCSGCCVLSGTDACVSADCTPAARRDSCSVYFVKEARKPKKVSVLNDSLGPIWTIIRNMQNELEILAQHVARAGDAENRKKKKK